MPVEARDTVILGDGRRLSASIEGGAGEPCVLLHGLGEGAFVWDSTVASLGAGRRTIRMDFCGHGDADWSLDGRYEIDRLVDDVISALDELQIRRATFVGHSLGGDVALRLALRRPALCRRLVLVDTGPGGSPEATAFIEAQLLESHREFASVEVYAAWLGERRPLVAAASLQRYARGALRPTPGGGLIPKFDPRITQLLHGDADGSWWRDALSSMSCACLLVRGAGSAVLSQKAANSMVDQSRSMELVVVPRAGHAVMTDNPADFSAKLVAYLDRS